ncbi:MAG: hypothetical protein R3D80_05670 [Paracoccaceae bacterium]
MNCIAGLTDPTTGQVFIGDRNATPPSRRSAGSAWCSSPTRSIRR